MMLRVHDVTDHAMQVHQFAARDVALPRKGQQVAHDAFCASCLATDRLQRLPILNRPRAAKQQLRKSADGRERIVQLVRHTSQHVLQ